MSKIRSNARQIIEERSYCSGCSLREYVEREAKKDPDFFRWLFDEELDEDLDTSLNEEQREIYNEFIENL